MFILLIYCKLQLLSSARIFFLKISEIFGIPSIAMSPNIFFSCVGLRTFVNVPVFLLKLLKLAAAKTLSHLSMKQQLCYVLV